MSGQVFVHEHRVTYSSCTIGNHIYYSRYLDILEEARGEFFRSLGRTFLHWQEEGLIFPVVECWVRYQSAARYDDVLRIEIRLSQLTKVRLSFGYRVFKNGDQRILEARTDHVSCNLEEKPVRMPTELLAKLEPFMSSADAETEKR